jgi:uncharacterized protein YndB with AHSA1/START domain
MAASLAAGGHRPQPSIVSAVEIDRPPDEVFAYATDPTRFAQWQKDVVGVRVDGASRFVTTRRMPGGERAMTQEITESVAPRRWAARGIDGPVRPSATITIEPLDGGNRSRVTFALDFEAHGIGVPLLPLIRRMAAKAAPVSYRNLKQLLEGQPA